MLRISVILFDGVAPAVPTYCEFDERGGSIGRDISNKMALPDPDRVLSRMQAQVQFAAGEYRLLDHGGNPTSLNGRPIGKGNVTALHDGDELQMGNYVLRAEFLRAPPKSAAVPVASATPTDFSSTTDPLGLLGDSNRESAKPEESSGEFELLLQPPPTQPAFTASQAVAGEPTPTNAKTPPAAALSDDPFAVFAKSPSTPTLRATDQKTAPHADISDDPFAAFAPKPAPQPRPNAADAFSTPSAQNPLGIDLGQAEGSGSVDDMFGLGAPATTDPFASTPLADPLRAPPKTEEVDPLALLSGTATPVISPSAQAPVAARHDSDILRDAFVPPPPVKAAAPEPAPLTETIPEPTASVATDPLSLLNDANAPRANETNQATPPGGVVSWGHPSADAAVLIGDLAAPVAPPSTSVTPTPAPSTPPSSSSQPAAPRAKVSVQGLGEAVVPEPTVTAPTPITPSGDDAELLAAFVRGLGMQSLKIPGGVTPQFMEQVGVMLREAVKGTVELLVARAAIKREVRAEVTMIVSRNNNPLKFSPDVDFALTQLLAPHGSGFMPPIEAMRDAYDDLRAHQLGFMAGMRAAIAGLLAKFRPEDLETRLADKSFLDSLLPSNRKGKLWDLFSQRYSEISHEAEEDFHALFGREFLKAYEAQIDRLQNKR